MKYIFLLVLTWLTTISLKAQEQDLKAYLDSAKTYQLSGDTMEVYYLTKALQLQPYNPTLYELRAYAKSYIKKENDNRYGPKGAIRDLDIAIKLDKKNAIYFEQRGYQKYLLSSYFEALKDLNKAVKLDGSKASAYRKRADIYWGIQFYQKALYDFYEAYKRDTGSVYNIRKMADCFYELGNYRDALKHYDLSIKKSKARPSFTNSYSEDYVLSLLYRGNSFSYYSKVNNAIEDYTEVIDYNEKFLGIIEYTYEAYRYRGLSYLRNDKKKEGCEDLNAALKLGDPEAQDYIETYCQE